MRVRHRCLDNRHTWSIQGRAIKADTSQATARQHQTAPSCCDPHAPDCRSASDSRHGDRRHDQITSSPLFSETVSFLRKSTGSDSDRYKSFSSHSVDQIVAVENTRPRRGVLRNQAPRPLCSQVAERQPCGPSLLLHPQVVRYGSTHEY
jgi:hypothetical protein